MTRLERWAYALLLLAGTCAACINAPTPRLVPLPPQEPDTAGWRTLADSILPTADGVLVARIREIKEDWAYDDPCGVVKIAMKQCDGTTTYKVHIDDGVHDRWLWTFALSYGTFGLYTGEYAIFIWKKTLVYRYQQCREQMGMTSEACPWDFLQAMTSDLDVLPPSDSARVDSLFSRPRAKH